MTAASRSTDAMTPSAPDGARPARRFPPPWVPRRRAARASRARGALRRALLLCASTCAAGAHAFDADALNEAQSLIYERPHLAGTAAGDELRYAWTASGSGAERGEVTDRATLTVAAAHEDGTRDVRLDFLSGERRLALPDFDGWRANPVLLAAFERFAQDFASASGGGGGALYFRNRMRDALAGAPSTEAVELEFGGARVAATRIEFAPFADDPYVGSRPGFADAVVRLELSDAVPGGVLSAAVESAGGPYRRELRLDAGAADGGAARNDAR